MYVTVVNRIVSAMRAAGLNPNSLSEMANRKRGYIRDLVRGLDDPTKAGVPKQDALEGIQRATGHSVAWLRGETDDPSVDAADLVPDTPQQRNVVARMKTLSEAGQKKIEGAVEMMTPRIIKVTGKQDEILYDGPERRVNYYPDYDGPNRRNTH